MNTKIKFTFAIICATFLIAFSSCESIKEKLAVPIPINDIEITFEVQPASQSSPAAKAPAVTAVEKVLLDKTFDVNIVEEAEKLGYDMDNIIEFVITAGRIELVEPAGFDMNEFKNVKIYFDNQTKLVAEVDKIENNKILIKIVNGDLLQKLKDDKLHVIITGDDLPSKRVKLKFISSYRAKINVFK